MSRFNSSHNGSSQSASPLRSSLAGDPEMLELIAFFVDEIGTRIELIRGATHANDFARLRLVANTLKIAATGYGFGPISHTAGALEELIDTTQPDEPTEALRQRVDELIGLCQRVAV